MGNLVPKTREYREIKFLPSDFTRKKSYRKRYLLITFVEVLEFNGITKLTKAGSNKRREYLWMNDRIFWL